MARQVENEIKDGNFSFMKNVKMYEKSDIYKRMYRNVKFAEGAYYINADICCFYIRRSLELLCKIVEVSKDLKIVSFYSDQKKTVGTYVSKENIVEFAGAVGGPNCALIKKLNEGLNEFIHEEHKKGINKMEIREAIIGLFQLMVWFCENLKFMKRKIY